MNKITMMTLAAGTLLALGAGAFAQQDADMMGKPVTSMDRQYLMKNAQGSVSDYANGEAAAQTGDSAVRAYGVRLMEDHNRLNIEMLQLAGRRGLTLPLTISETDKTKIDALTAHKGMDFDREFLREAIKTNTQDVTDAQKELAETTDSEVHIAVTDFLSTEQSHLAEAKQIQAGMGAMSGRR